MYYFLKAYRHTLPNNAGHYRGAQRAGAGLYERVSLLDDRIHSNTAALSTDRLGGQIATINHHLSADLQAPRGSLRGPPDATVLNSCLVPSILPSLASAQASAFVFLSPPTLLLYLLPTRLSLALSRDLVAAISSELVRRLIFVLNEASVLLRQGVTGQSVIISPLCHSRSEHGGRSAATI